MEFRSVGHVWCCFTVSSPELASQEAAEGQNSAKFVFQSPKRKHLRCVIQGAFLLEFTKIS